MSFKTRQIRQRPPLHICRKIGGFFKSLFNLFSKTSPKQRSYIVGTVLVFIGIFIVWKVMVVAYNFVTGFNPKDIIFSLGADLKKDANGYTNIVLLGDGGHVRDGADLVDTIMVASIDYNKNAVTLFSIPRDYYVSNINWPGKINELYRNNKRQFESDDELYGLFQTETGEIANLDVQYYVRVNFNAFVEVIDSLGGITVEVKEDLYDPYYPNETDDGYTIFEVKKGPQEMDGETALKFVRSRKTTSDFDRAFRQQQILEAVRAKALSKGVLTKTKTLQKLYDTVKANMNTNLTFREMVALGAFADGFDRSHLVSKVIHDDPGQDGGFLYTPEKELYNNMFVLIPFGDNLDLIHKYADLIFNHREAFWDPPKIEVLNATKASGIARNVAYQLNRFGFNVVSIDNLYDENGEKKYLDKSVIYYYDWEEEKDADVSAKYRSTIDALGGFIQSPAMPMQRTPFTTNADLSIVLGDDYSFSLAD